MLTAEPPRPAIISWCPPRCAACVQLPFCQRRNLWTPFSVVFTDWPSMMAALGIAARPADSRTRTRRVDSTPSQVPSSRQLRKYHHTVPQGGRSWGIRRQGIPPLSTYRMPLTTSLKSVVLGCPFWCRVAARAPAPPTGHRSNRWDKVFCSCPRVTSTLLSHQEEPARLCAIVTHS